MIFNTPGHAADWRSIGSNARITRGMKAGKRCSAALPAHSTAPSIVPSSQAVDGESDRSSVRVPTQPDEQRLGSVRVSFVRKRGRHHAEAVGTPGRAGHGLLRALHGLRVLASGRVQQTKIRPPYPEAGIELHGLAGVIDRFILQSQTLEGDSPA